MSVSGLYNFYTFTQHSLVGMFWICSVNILNTVGGALTLKRGKKQQKTEN